MTVTSHEFLGRGWKFPPEFDLATRAVSMVAGEEDIRESLRILLTTGAGERVMRPDYGGTLDRHLFAPLEPTSLNMIRGSLEAAILRFEPRIVLEDLAVRPSDELHGVLWIDVHYRVISTNTRHNLVFPFYLDEGTNVASP